MTAPKRGTIPIDSVVEEFFVRTALDDNHVLHLATLYEGGAKLPAVIVARERNRLIDGRHRLAALKLLDKKSIDVEWDEETDDGVLIARALRANIGGSLPPTNADISYAMTQMIAAGLTYSVIMKDFSSVWPPAVIRKYYAEAATSIRSKAVIKAKEAVLNGMTVGEAAMTFKVKLDVLKSAIAGKKVRKSGTSEYKRQLSSIFRSRGGSMGGVMKRLLRQYEDGEMTYGSLQQVLDYADTCCKNTTDSVRGWRKRFAAMHEGQKKTNVA